ncbi:MAG: UDP-3-O-(3-hydroxymyristoyl)glucosamine N-acyltransferase [Lewinellaceae bacterium]|nr:UDP-3-O-(3-hydroxymyristoyl)glucosamine N-acyltransferase [Lewinellaceae bacterium]
MKVTAAQLAQLLQGTLEGNPDASVSRPARIEEAGDGDLAFLDNPRYESHAYTTSATILLVHESFKPTSKVKPTLIRVPDVRSSLAILLQQFQNVHSGEGVISAHAAVHEGAQIAAGTDVGDFVVVEAGAVIGSNCRIYGQAFIGANVRIGDHCTIFPGARILHDCQIGNHCVVHSNAVIGSDGFGFAPQPDGTWKKVPQVGNVVLEDYVEVGANSCIDRAALGSTLIRMGAKLDNLVHIAHNVEVGRNTVMAAQVGVAGSTKIGDNCQLGGQTGIAGHLTLADGTRTQAQSGLGSSVKEPGKALFGAPAIDYNDYVRSYVVFKQLPDLQKRIRSLEKALQRLMQDDNANP